MASIAKLVVTLGANVAGFETDMNRATRNQKKRMRQMEQDAKAIGRGLAIAFTAATGAMAAVVRSTTNTADSMAKLGQRLGASTEALSELGYVAEKSGVDFRTLEMGLQRMTRRIGEVAFLGKGEAKEALEVLGFEARKLADLPLDKQFEAIAEELSKVGNTSQRTSLAMKIFDAEGVKLVQMMEQGSAGISELREEMRKTGAVISTELATSAEQFNNNLAEMEAYAKGAAVQFTSGLLPGLVDIQEYFLANAESINDMADAGEWLADVIKRLIAAFMVMKGIATALGKALVGISMAIYNSFKALFLAVKRPIDQLAMALDALTRGELKQAAEALGDIPQAMADGWNDGARETLNALNFIGTGLEDIQASIDAAFDLLNTRSSQVPRDTAPVVQSFDSMGGAATSAAGDIEEVIVTAEKMPDVIDDAATSATASFGTMATEFDAMATAMDEGVRILERAFTSLWDSLINGSEDAFSGIVDGFKSLLAQMIHQATTQPIMLNIQQAFGPGGQGTAGLNWTTIGTGIAGTVGTILGQELGGGGTGATYGSILGALGSGTIASFAASMAMGMGSSAIWGQIAGVFAGPLGMAIGAIIGGLIGGLFDKDRPPVAKISGNDTMNRESSSDKDTQFNTAFGTTFLSTRRLDAEAINSIIEGVKAFDEVVSGLLDDGTIAAITADLADWGLRLKGDQISMEKILQTRMDIVLANISDEVARFVRAGGSMEDQIDRLATGLSAEKIMAEYANLFPNKSVTDFLSLVDSFRTGTMSMSQALEALLPLIEQIVTAQDVLRGYADTSALDQLAALAPMTLAETVASIQAALGDAIANFDGSPDQLTYIANLAMSAREGEIRLLQQIDSIQKGVFANLDSLEAQIRGVVDGPKSTLELVREASALQRELFGATSAEEVADIERRFTALVRQFSPEQMEQEGAFLLKLIDNFRTVAADQFEIFRQNAEANAESTRELTDIFINDIGDPLDILASSNVSVSESMSSIDESISQLGPTIRDAIGAGFNNVRINVTVVSDEAVVNE